MKDQVQTNKPASFREILKREFEVRAIRNPSYSLRSFARDLTVAPSSLSEIMNGVKGLSAKKAITISKKLGWDTETTHRFLDQVVSECSRHLVQKKAASERLAKGVVLKTKEISLDNIQLISDPTHYVIYAMTGLADFQSDPSWIAKKVGISTLQTRLILERLLKLELISKIDGKYVSNQALVTTKEEVPSEAIKSAHERVLTKAIDSLHLIPLDERDYRNMIFPMNQSDLEEMKNEIKEFSRGLAKKYQTAANKNSVVSVSLQVVPWVRANRKREKKGNENEK